MKMHVLVCVQSAAVHLPSRLLSQPGAVIHLRLLFTDEVAARLHVASVLGCSFKGLPQSCWAHTAFGGRRAAVPVSPDFSPGLSFALPNVPFATCRESHFAPIFKQERHIAVTLPSCLQPSRPPWRDHAGHVRVRDRPQRTCWGASWKNTCLSCSQEMLPCPEGRASACSSQTFPAAGFTLRPSAAGLHKPLKLGIRLELTPSPDGIRLQLKWVWTGRRLHPSHQLPTRRLSQQGSSFPCP